MSPRTSPATLTAHVRVLAPDRPVDIHPDIYGQYFEHVEDCIYPGVMDESGVRTDVIDAASDLEVPVVRWPGGCFADAYHWEDGIGPADERPVRPNWHWGGGQLESHRFGTHEFLDWCEQVGARPYINVNLGTGSLIEALRWLDYTTGTHETADVQQRKRNGRDRPWTVPYWGIGNETWGSWEAGRMTAAEYADTLANWADFFRRYRSDLTIVGVGSRAGQDPDWDRTVLDAAGDRIDLLSLHLYGSRLDDPARPAGEEMSRRAVMLAPLHFDAQITAMAQLLRADNARSERNVGITLDEWNIRHYVPQDGGHALHRAAARTGTDALFVAGVFHSMIRAADLVRMANYVFLVNGNAVLDARHGTLTRSSLFPLFQAYRQRLSGQRMSVEIAGDTIEVPPLTSGRPTERVDPASIPAAVPAVDAVASRDASGRLWVALINRSEQPVEVSLAVEERGDQLTVETYQVRLADDSLEHLPARSTGPLVTLPAASCSFVSSPS